MIGRSEAWLSQVERGIRHVDRVSVLIRLAQVLKVTVEDLIGQPLSLAPNGGIEFRAIPALRAALTNYELIPATFGVATGDGPTRGPAEPTAQCRPGESPWSALKGQGGRAFIFTRGQPAGWRPSTLHWLCSCSSSRASPRVSQPCQRTTGSMARAPIGSAHHQPNSSCSPTPASRASER